MALNPAMYEQVVSAARRGDHHATEQLVKEHERWIRSVIFAVLGRGELVDDVAQQVWTRVWEKLPTLSRPQNLRSWLYRIARNAAIDAGKHARLQRDAESALQIDPLAPHPRASATSTHDAPAGELHGAIMQAIRALPAIYREPFVLRHLQEWSYAEIGEVLSLPVATVETRLVRARRLLRELLADEAGTTTGEV